MSRFIVFFLMQKYLYFSKKPNISCKNYKFLAKKREKIPICHLKCLFFARKSGRRGGALACYNNQKPRSECMERGLRCSVAVLQLILG